MAEGKLQTAEQWSRFWQAGSLTTFVGRFEHNYDGDVLAFWQSALSALPDDAQIVDLATGNGALALLAAEIGEREGKAFAVTGVDYADIDPAASMAEDARRDIMAGIQFVGNTRIEQTGLDAGTFDAAISQFGFEYGDPVAAIIEVARILKPEKSRFAAILHHTSSDILKQATDGLKQVAACEACGLHEPVRALLTRLDIVKSEGRNPATDVEAERLRKQLNSLTEQMHAQQEGFDDPSMFPYYLKNTMAVFNPRLTGEMTLAQKLEHLAAVDLFTADYRQRMEDLSAAARSPADIEQMEAAFASHGFRIERSDAFHYESTRFGHALIAAR